MPETLPRPLVALTVIIAIAAIYVGVKDHFDQKKQANSQANAIAATDSSHKNDSAAKKIHAKKSKGKRTNTPEASARGMSNGDSGQTAKQLIRDEFAEASANRTVMADMEQHAGTLNAEPEGGREARNGERRRSHEYDAWLASCLPLPNMTKPGDVDAPYYENWAKEYCGR